jgi:uncharacterized protein
MTVLPELRPTRVSGYTIAAPLSDDGYVLLHGYTGTVDKVRGRIGQFLAEHAGQQVERPAFMPKPAWDFLIERGYVTDLDQEDERQAVVQLAETLHNLDLAESPIGFMFIPAYTCNLRCPYCFQSHDLHAGKGQFGRVLSCKQVDDAFRIIDRMSAPGALAAAVGLHADQEAATSPPRPGTGDICLFGGEPLAGNTLDVVTHIVASASERGRGVAAVTNGVELAAFKDLLGPGKIRELQITLDGSAPFHDRRRVGPGFKKTFDLISHNIDLALAQGVSLSLRMNVDSRNAAEVESLTDYAAARGWSGNPLFSGNAAAVTGEKLAHGLMTQADLTRLTMDIRSRKPGTIRGYEKIAEDVLRDAMFSQAYPFSRVANCAAETGMLMFDAFGDVYSCWEEIGEPAHRTATYDADGLRFVGDVARTWLSRFPGAIEECSRCPYALIHTSGCGKHAAQMTGTIFASACESFQEYFPASLAFAYERLEREIRAERAAPGMMAASEGCD